MKNLIRTGTITGALVALMLTSHSANAAVASPDASKNELPLAVPSAPAPSAPGCTGLCNYGWTKLVTVGPGLPAASIRFDRKLGFADRVAPIELGLNLFQRQYVPDGNHTPEGTSKIVLWRVALGITVTKSPDTSDVTLGAYLAPLGVQIDSFALGVGLAYSATGEAQSKNGNWAIVVPFSYAVQLL